MTPSALRRRVRAEAGSRPRGRRARPLPASIALLLLAAPLAAPLEAQGPAPGVVADPIPDAPVMSRLGLVLRELVTFPRSEPTPAPADGRLARQARINHVGEIPDGSRRLYVPDLNGTLYVIREGVVVRYLDVRRMVGDDFFSGRGMGSGFGFVAFHPEFARNGRFYTVHTEAADALVARRPDFTQPNAVVHGVITEWVAERPGADAFSGTRREVLRIGFAGFVHGIQQIDFDPTVRPDDDEYGLLYVAVGDGGRGVSSDDPQDLAVPFGKILRIDPSGSDGAGGRYGVPRTNPFVRRGGALGEIWAYGMRDPHRFSWDADGRGRMLLGHIGERAVEAIYEVRAGDNLGWSEREGPFAFDRASPCALRTPPPDEAGRAFVRPVAAYDHDRAPGQPCEDAGHAVAGGFVYRGHALPELRGRYLFTDLVDGRVMYADAREMRRGAPRARIHELAIFDEAGRETTMAVAAGSPRVDLRLGRDADGEPYLLSKANGVVWKVVGTAQAATTSTVFPSLAPDLVVHYDFEHPDPRDASVELDQGKGGVPLRLVNGGAAMRVRDGAYAASRTSIQLRQVAPGVAGNDDWKAGAWSDDGVQGLGALNGARGATVMGWFKLTGPIPGARSSTRDTTDRYDAVGLAGILSGTSDGHLVRALLELITVDGALRLAAVGRRVDAGKSQALVATAPVDSLLPRDTWVFLAATFDFARGRMALYRDGRALAASYAGPDDPWDIAGDGSPAASPTDPRGIKIGGSFPQNTRELNSCDCRVDDVLVVARALTPLEVSQQFRRMASARADAASARR